MKRLGVLAFLFSLSTAITASAQQSIDGLLDRDIAQLVSTYKMLHAAPELSHHEEKTAAFVASQLRALGYTVTERVGKYAQPEWTSYGVVAVMKNGAGPTVLVRTELDALPVEEKTGLAYASTVKAKNDAGQEVSVMHACGHDSHIAILMGVADVLSKNRAELRGTVKFLFQPAEEGPPEGEEGGAALMVKDGVLDNPKVDVIFGLHISSTDRVGNIGYRQGGIMAAQDSYWIKVKGRQAHGASPWSGMATR